MEEKKNNEQEEIKGCIFPAIIVIMVMIMAFVTITFVNNRIKKVEATQDTILKTIRGYDCSTAVVDSTATDTAMQDSSVVADDEYCEDCENGDEEDDEDTYYVPMIETRDGRHIPAVYICSGRYAKKYHIDRYCDGLQSCKGTIGYTSLQSAKDRGMTPCRRCIPRP